MPCKMNTYHDRTDGYTLITGDSLVTDPKSWLKTLRPIMSRAKLENSASRSNSIVFLTPKFSPCRSFSNFSIVLSEQSVNILTIASKYKTWNPGAITAKHFEIY
jgi:hypothetical protein